MYFDKRALSQVASIMELVSVWSMSEYEFKLQFEFEIEIEIGLEIQRGILIEGKEETSETDPKRDS